MLSLVKTITILSIIIINILGREERQKQIQAIAPNPPTHINSKEVILYEK
tara:strand:+ start:839 stop:988 length:150 start_codon:yes stop_codon:yes gene_type:complete